MSEAQKRAVELKKDIEAACIRHNLNLTVYDGKMDLWIRQREK